MHPGSSSRTFVRARRCRAILVSCVIVFFAGVAPSSAQQPPPPEPTHPLTQDECIAIALHSQPAIHVQEAAVGAANELQRQARAGFLPQANLSSRYTQLDKPLFQTINNPLSGSLGQSLADSSAFFAIARQAGSQAALAALNQPNSPPFSTARQLALSMTPDKLNFEIFGTSLFYTQALVTQPLFTGGKIIYRNQQAKLGVDAAGADLAKSRQQTIFEVTRAYQGILLAHELTRSIEGAEGQFRAVEKLAQSLLDNGDESVTVADVSRARAVRLLAGNSKVEFEKVGELAHAALRQAMGMPQDQPLAIADTFLTIHRVEFDEATVLAQALARRPEMRKADLNVQNAMLEEKIAKAQLCPSIGLFGSLTTLNGKRDFPNPGNDYEWQVGVAGEVPLFTGGRNLAAIRQAKHKVQQAVQTRNLAQDLIALEVKQAYLGYKEMSERMGSAEAAIKDAQATLKAYNDQYTAKLIGNKEVPKYFENVTTGRLLLFTAESRYQQQAYEYNLATAKLRLVTAADE